MFKKTWLISAMVGSLLPAFNPGFAADPPVQNQAQEQMQEQMYGSQLMTPQERTEHQARMRAAKTSEEREQIRAQHHKEMQVRARQQGVTLPVEPPAQGKAGGVGPGGGAGGMGPGGGGR